MLCELPTIHRFFFFFQAEDGIRDYKVTGVQTCALPILSQSPSCARLDLRSQDTDPLWSTRSGRYEKNSSGLFFGGVAILMRPGRKRGGANAYHRFCSAG